MIESGKCVLVTGSNGYIGSHVVRALLDKGAAVVAADMSTEHVDVRAEKLNCDIFNTSIEQILSGRKPDAVIHFAWQDGFQHKSLKHMEMVSSHFDFLTGLAKAGIRQIAVMGSMHEVGYYEGAIDENTPCHPQSLYGVAKNALRQAMELYCRENGIIYQWLRGFYICGDDRRNHSVFTKIFEAAAEGEKEFPFVSGKNRCDFISIDELADQISACILQREVTGVINCCSGVAVSLREAAEKFIQKYGLNIKLKYGMYPDRAYDSPAIWGNNDKIQQIMRKEKGS